MDSDQNRNPGDVAEPAAPPRARVVGVLGGMGPDATVDFMDKVIAATPAAKDQDHIAMLVDHNPAVPNRQEAILRGGTDPGPALATMARRLEAAGADFLVIPCNTAYVFADRITAAVDVPLVSIIDVTIDAILERCGPVAEAGVLATDGCLESGVYQQALEAKGIAAVLPGATVLGRVMQLINAIKGGDRSDDVRNAMRRIADSLIERGAEAVIAGCTEIPLVLEDGDLTVPLISSTDVLARRTVALARGDVDIAAGVF